ncbi:iron-sulfur cluster insertion protein ErpA [Anaerolineales bacterium]
MALAESTNVGAGTEEIMITVTPAATTVIKDLLQQREIPNHALRVFVSGGGCSGMQYGMAFQETAETHDAIVDVADGVRLFIDPTSIIYLQGAVIDFVDSLMGGGFRIDNPNAASSCGCGQSFKSPDGEAASSESDSGCGCGCSSSY